MVARSDFAARRILISPAGSVRQTILTLPIAEALREHFTDAHIAWAVDKPSAPILAGHRAIDQTIVLPPGWFVSPPRLHQLRGDLRRQRFEIAIDCQGTAQSATLGWLSGAAKRIGFRTQGGRTISQHLNNVLIQPVFTHLTDRALELLIPLDIHSPKVRWNLPISNMARHWAVRWRRSLLPSKLAVISPGAGAPSKLWESDRYAATARYMRDRYGYRSVIAWGDDLERQMAQLIVFQSKHAATLAPDTDLVHLAALIEQADLLVGTDSAPLHLAAALATPSIGLLGATRPQVSGPYGQVAICQPYQGSRRRKGRHTDNSAMRRIGVDHVCQAVDQIEARRTARKSA